GGFCFPKDIDALIKSFEELGLNPELLKAVRTVNEQINNDKDWVEKLVDNPVIADTKRKNW
ncbi:MAG: hypothetical protein KAI20_02600, partial [Thermoplasmatales archaeon]|nr:hypothetical protein [Thermoplasmatales archaeon]